MILQGGFIIEKLQRRFGADIAAWFRTAVAEEGRMRGSLARGLCEFADWRNAKGYLCLASARGGVHPPHRQREGGVGWSSEFGTRLRQFGLRNGLFAAKELVVLSDGVPWIRNTCEEAFPGQEATFVLDLFLCPRTSNTRTLP